MACRRAYISKITSTLKSPPPVLPIKERTVIVGIVTQNQNEEKLTEYLDELEFLTYTAGGEVIKRFSQKLEKPNPELRKVEEKKAEAKKATIKKAEKKIVAEATVEKIKPLPSDYPQELIEINKRAKKVWDVYVPNHHIGQTVYLDIHYLGMTVGKIVLINKGKKVVNNRFYGHVRVDGVPTFNVAELR
jgi:hypothetical protein